MLTLSDKSRSKILGGLLLLLAIRVMTMFIIPLTDTTEARYAEIARKMLETGNWVTLLHEYATPFWAKPPLSTWCSAISMSLFGVNELAVRLPSLLLGLATAALVYYWVRKLRQADQSLITLTILVTSLLFLITIGAVMTDPSLLFATTLAMISFWQAFHQKSTLWGYGFFMALGIGLLAKGPVAIVLTMFPIGLWVLYRKKIRETWHTLPWISGTLLMLAIALPWYLLAESRTPGFLKYFIIGEHFSRFIESGWHGDLYGHPHIKPFGTIWVYWIAGAFPWSLFAIWSLIKRKGNLGPLLKESDGWAIYLLFWTLTPLVFFTFSKNIILTYSLTGLPAFAILFVEAWQRLAVNKPFFLLKDKVLFGGIIPLILVSIVLLLCSYNSIPGINKRSQKLLAEYFMTTRPSEQSQLAYFIRHYYSAEFYSGGKAYTIPHAANILALLDNDTIDYLAVPLGKYGMIPEETKAHFEICDRFGNVVLYKEKINTKNHFAAAE